MLISEKKFHTYNSVSCYLGCNVYLVLTVVAECQCILVRHLSILPLQGGTVEGSTHNTLYCTYVLVRLQNAPKNSSLK